MIFFTSCLKGPDSVISRGGFDNSPIASEAILPITTIGQQIDVIAKTAMDLLVQQMEEQKKRVPKPLGEPVHKQIAPVLIRRNTTK